jgi:hypothetical protein
LQTASFVRYTRRISAQSRSIRAPCGTARGVWYTTCLWRLRALPSRDYQILRHASSGDISSLGETDRTSIGITLESRSSLLHDELLSLGAAAFLRARQLPHLAHCATAASVHVKWKRGMLCNGKATACFPLVRDLHRVHGMWQVSRCITTSRTAKCICRR